MPSSGTRRPCRFKADKSVKRFYEVLILLHTLERSQGSRIPEDRSNTGELCSQTTVQGRRELLRHLCIVCDYEKGGTTVTSMALQQEPEGPTYWVAAPGNASSRIIPFLQQILQTLYEVAKRPADQAFAKNTEQHLFRSFQEFGRKRLIDTRKLLQKAAEREREQARLPATIDWLGRCQEAQADAQDLLTSCRWAYDARYEALKHPPHQDQQYCVRHYIGRIASVHRAATTLVRLAPSLISMFENFKIQSVSCGTVMRGPVYDEHMTLDGIARRMVAADQEEKLHELTAGLQRLDRTIGLQAEIKKAFDNPNFKPKTHAEIAILEAVHQADIDFYDNDRYIACSKPACFCCYHYICIHPGNFVRPASHNNLWYNWKIPDLVPNANEVAKVAQRDVMIKMTATIRSIAIAKVIKQSGLRSNMHPDSTTGITLSVTVASPSLPFSAEADVSLPTTDVCVITDSTQLQHKATDSSENNYPPSPTAVSCAGKDADTIALPRAPLLGATLEAAVHSGKITQNQAEFLVAYLHRA